MAATGAMLFEGLAIVTMGTKEVHFSHLLIFIGPILATIGMIVFQYRKEKDRPTGASPSEFHVLPILKLAIFIVFIISVSRIFQKIFGENGLLVLTSLVSLFEIHGSVIANVQLHESGRIAEKFLCSLLAISVVSSYLSKLFLIATLGSPALRTSAVKCTLFLFASLAISWALAVG